MGTGASRPGASSLHALRAIQRMPRKTTSNPNSMETTTESSTVPNTTDNVVTQNGAASKGEGRNVANGNAGAGDVDKLKEAVKAQGESDGAKVKEELKNQTDREEEDEDEEKEKAKKKKEPLHLTEEQIEEGRVKYIAKTKLAIDKIVSVPCRDEEQEERPYNMEMRSSLLCLAKSYFYFAYGQVSPDFLKAYRGEIAAYMCDKEVTESVCDVITEGLVRRDFINEEGKMILKYWLPMKNALLVLLDYSDASDDVKRRIIGKTEYLKETLKILNEWKELHLKGELSDNRNKLLIWCTNIFHNCGAVEENVSIMREINTLQCLLPYLDSPNQRLRLSALATVADLANEEEAELLKTHTAIYQFLLKLLGKAIKAKNHREIGWSVWELTRAVRQIARNDANKKVLVEEGCLPILVSVLHNADSDEELKEAIDCLWILSFNQDNKQKMVQEAGLVECVWRGYQERDHSIQNSCHGVLWSLKEQLSKSGNEGQSDIGEKMSSLRTAAFLKGKTSARAPSAGSFSGYEGHVMISYQWGNQAIIKRIAQELRANGIPIWLDIDYMEGSTLQAMAKAVEDSFTVIIAMSQKYKDSPNTRAEAEYAFQKRKKIIPLIMQREYRPDGWLGFILGSKLYYDFSGKYSFDSKMEGLLKAITSMGDNLYEPTEKEKPVFAVVSPTYATSPLHPTLPVARVNEQLVKNWTQAEVTQWLDKHGVGVQPPLTGEEILFLRSVKVEAPLFFYTCLEKKLDVTSLLDMSRFTQAIMDLPTL